MRPLRIASTLLILIGFFDSTQGASNDGWSRFEIPLPGTLVASADDQAWGGHTLVVMLAGEEGDGPRRVAFLELVEGQPLLRFLAGSLDGEPEELVFADVDGDGRAEILVAEEGDVVSLGRPHLGDAGGPRGSLGQLPRGSIHPVSRLDAVPPSGLTVTRAGRLDRLVLGTDGRLEVSTSMPLPMSADRRVWGLELESPAVSAWGEDRWVVGSVGDGPRVASHLLAEGTEPAVAWSQLPGTEQLQTSRYALVDDELLLVATSVQKKGMMAKQRLRLFRPEATISRAGGAPIFEAETESRFWYEVDTRFADLDEDGVSDLVALYPQGLGGGEFQIDTFRGLGGGRFDPRGHRTKLQLDEPQFEYGHDVTGDGIPDLVTMEGRSLAIWKGLTGPAAWKLVSRTPTWQLSVRVAPENRQEVEVEVGSDGGEVRRLRRRHLDLLDLDGDAVDEILVWGREGNGNAHLTLLSR